MADKDTDEDSEEELAPQTPQAAIKTVDSSRLCVQHEADSGGGWQEVLPPCRGVACVIRPRQSRLLLPVPSPLGSKVDAADVSFLGIVPLIAEIDH